MPELPEVEAARVLVDRHCTGKVIEDVTCADDDKVIEDPGPRDLEAAVKGHKLLGVHRKGKHMWLDLDNSPALMFHFGMSGAMVVEGIAAAQYKSFVVDEVDWPPKFWKVLLHFEGGVKLAFTDVRRFARVRLQQDPLHNKPLTELGFDVFLDRPDAAELGSLLAKRKQAIKTVLLDQAFSAGVGNWVADEVLHCARIHPEQKAHTLTDEQTEQLRWALIDVPATACAVEADSSRFPGEWIFHSRWSEKKAPKDISFIKTTAFRPSMQKLPSGQSLKAKKADAPQKEEKVAQSSGTQQQQEAKPKKAEQKPPRPKNAPSGTAVLAVAKGAGSTKAKAKSTMKRTAADTDDAPPKKTKTGKNAANASISRKRS